MSAHEFSMLLYMADTLHNDRVTTERDWIHSKGMHSRMPHTFAFRFSFYITNNFRKAQRP